MVSFKGFMLEADISNFMTKIYDCKTLDGLDELEGYYTKRAKEKDVELKQTDDITIRDAIAGRRQEIKDDLAANKP